MVLGALTDEKSSRLSCISGYLPVPTSATTHIKTILLKPLESPQPVTYIPVISRRHDTARAETK